MSHLPDELRLAITIGLNVFVFVAAFQLVRSLTGQDWIGNALDAFLIHYAVQYLAVCVPGIFGALSAETMLLTGVALSAAIFWFAHKGFPDPFSPRAHAGSSARDEENPALARGLNGKLTRFDSLFCCASLLFVIGYFIELIRALSSAPLVGDDGLTYHLPSAGYWLQTGKIALYNTWFFNPANTYSPLAGTAFLVWLIAPIGADIIAQFAQMPALVLIFFAIVQFARSVPTAGQSAAPPRVSSRIVIASLIATGALLSRPFISEAILVKDDHFLAAFFIAAVAGCAAPRLQDRLGPWRIGMAVGLFFATKYTALLTAPLLLLVIDAPFRAGWKWRHWTIALGCVFVIAGPWYLRNWIMTGNPIYPVPVSIAGLEIFKGMFIPERSTAMRTLSGAWNALTGYKEEGGGYNSPSPLLMYLLLIGWAATVVVGARRLQRDPLMRLLIIGPALGLAIFFFASHAALIRYAYPSLLLLFACCVGGKDKGDTNLYIKVRVTFILVVVGVSIWGGFNSKELLGQFLLGAVIVCGLGMFAALVIAPQMRRPRVRLAVWCAVGLIASGAIYVQWRGILIAARDSAIPGLSGIKPDDAEMWRTLWDDLPLGAPLAYTNVIFTRPLMGFHYARPIFYIPTRPRVSNYHDLPPGRQRVADEEIRGFVTRLLTEQPDQKLWLQHLLESPAQYLLVGSQPVLIDPPEKAFAASDPAHFLKMREDRSGTLYRIVRD